MLSHITCNKPQLANKSNQPASSCLSQTQEFVIYWVVAKQWIMTLVPSVL